MTDRTAILAKLARLAASNAAQQHLATRLCEASRLILGADGAWIPVHGGTAERVPLSATDQTASTLEDLQDLVGQGPCRDSYTFGVAVSATVRDAPDARWPEFCRSAWHRVGPVTIHAFPMRPARDTFGVLSIYFAGTGAPAESDDAAQFLADAVGAALLRDPVAPTDSGITEGMWSARAEVHQATGMVIAQLRFPPDDALAILRAHAYAHDTTVADIAHRVVNRRLDFRGDS